MLNLVLQLLEIGKIILPYWVKLGSKKESEEEGSR